MSYYETVEDISENEEVEEESEVEEEIVPKRRKQKKWKVSWFYEDGRDRELQFDDLRIFDFTHMTMVVYLFSLGSQ